MKNFKALIMFVIIFFGMYFVLVFMASIICHNTFQDNLGVTGLMVYTILLGWWISLIGNPYINTSK